MLTLADAELPADTVSNAGEMERVKSGVAGGVVPPPPPLPPLPPGLELLPHPQTKRVINSAVVGIARD